MPADGRAGPTVTVQRRRVRVAVGPGATRRRRSAPGRGRDGQPRRRHGDDRRRRHGAADASPRAGAGVDQGDEARPRAHRPASTCVTTGGDGNCGTQLPPSAALGTEQPADTTAPVASFSGLRERQGVHAPARAARARGHGHARPVAGCGPCGSASCARSGDRCWTFDGARERFERHRCGGSQLVPDRRPRGVVLPAARSGCAKGRYTIRAVGDRQGRQRLGHRDGDPRPMRRRSPLILAGAVLAAPAAAEARGEGRRDGRRQQRGARRAERVALKARTAPVGGRRCSIGARDAALRARRHRRRRSACATTARARAARATPARSTSARSARTASAAATAGSTRSAAAPAAPARPTRRARSATGRRLRAGQQVLWFWCVKDAADACQRTLETSAARAPSRPARRSP